MGARTGGPGGVVEPTARDPGVGARGKERGRGGEDGDPPRSARAPEPGTLQGPRGELQSRRRPGAQTLPPTRRPREGSPARRGTGAQRQRPALCAEAGKGAPPSLGVDLQRPGVRACLCPGSVRGRPAQTPRERLPLAPQIHRGAVRSFPPWRPSDKGASRTLEDWFLNGASSFSFSPSFPSLHRLSPRTWPDQAGLRP